MCKKCRELESELKEASEKVFNWRNLYEHEKYVREAFQKDAQGGRNSEYWMKQSRYWRQQYEEAVSNNIDGDNLHNDMGCIVGGNSNKKDDPLERPKRKRRIGTKTEMKYLRSLLDNPKALWKEIEGLKGGSQ